MYKLDNRFAGGHSFNITVVGCGGTGGFVAEGLCRLLPEKARLMLIDHDRVEERNLVRQNFSAADLGEFKSTALARRLSREFRRPVAYLTLPVAFAEICLPGLVVGCVDNGPARKDIAQNLRGFVPHPALGYVSWWVDAGNGENYGQVLIGNRDGTAIFEDKDCFALPHPAMQRPEILQQAPLASQLDCAQIAEQGLTINQVMAALTVEVCWRIVEGSCSWMQLYVDMEKGTLQPVYATPEAAGQVIRGKKRRIYPERSRRR
ncbi:MAG: ThiF family adenylyltransferase [Chloroflexi bacterium]|nr:ThiF family adenylyltransferase [Chloroflexota bacterium]